MRILIILALFAFLSFASSCGVDRSKLSCCDSDRNMECCCLDERGREKYVWFCTYSRPYKRPAGSSPRCEKYYENELKMGKMNCLGCGEKGFQC
jgi:hypothetical protein